MNISRSLEVELELQRHFTPGHVLLTDARGSVQSLSTVVF